MKLLSEEEEFKKTKHLLNLTQLELSKTLSVLGELENKPDLKDRKVGIYFHTLKWFYCIEDLIKLSEHEGSIQSIITLSRMIIDNYSTLYLLTSHSSKEEQNIRYYLYLFDGINSRSRAISKFYEGIEFEPPEEIMENAQSALDRDSRDMKELILCIQNQNSNNIVSLKVIENLNWKFKYHHPNSKQKRNNKYGWKELYKLSGIPPHFSEMIQNYYSQFTHGLAISLMFTSENKHIPLLTSIFEIINGLIWNTLKILQNTFDDVIDEKLLNENTVRMMNEFWNDSFNENLTNEK